MMKVSLVFVHAKWMMMELLRQPTYIVSTIAFPSLFYLIFAVPESKSIEASNFLMASFAGFAFFGVVFLQFGVGLAQERSRSWYQFLKTLPVPSIFLLFARLITAIAFAILAVAAIVALSAVLTPAQMNFEHWARFILALFSGGLVFCFMGLALGYWASEKTSLPLGNLIYLPLSFLGGLWKPPELLPQSLKEISNILPTRFYGNLLWAGVKGEAYDIRSEVGLTLYLIIAGILAYAGYRREIFRRLSS